MIFRRLLLVLPLAHPMISIAWSADDSLLRKEMCIAQIKQRTAALVAQDWSALERLAERYAKICKNVFGEEDHSSAYEQMAIANVRLNNAKKALSASDSCINISYSNSGCHLQKIEALIMLKRLPDARATLDKAERLIRHLIDLNERDLRDARTALNKELFESRLNNLGAQQSHASALRNRYFSQ
jgi:tetratricopeptide (TPR) repeat protein